jgi:hypothetical protein
MIKKSKNKKVAKIAEFLKMYSVIKGLFALVKEVVLMISIHLPF